MKVRDQRSKTELLDLYRCMRLIRLFEEKAGQMYQRGKIRGFMHLYIGEEAIAAGAVAALSKQDYIVTHYRDHGHALARGIEPKYAMAELFGKATGCSAGKGGSMHFVDASKNFMGGYAIVAGQLTLAVGLAQAAQYLGEDRVVMVFFGDGAVNQGEFHESMNLASLWKLPIVFFLENNFYGMGSHIERTYAGGRDVYKSGDHYGMPSKQVDGMDVLEVYQATQDIVQQVRSGGGPFFVEALTYRFRGHSMADPVQYRGRTEEDLWRSRDPILTFTNHILEGQFATADDLKRLDTEVAKEIAEAVQFAEESPEPEADALYRDIYS